MSEHPEPTTIIGLILAGGEGRRFGGQDKGLVNYHGKLLVQHAMDVLSTQVDSTVIAIHRNKAEYEKINSWLVEDSAHSYEGPIAGITAAINDIAKRSQPCDYLAVTTCDTPHLPKDYVARLLSAFREAEKDHTADVAVAHDGHQQQNLHCIINASAFKSLLDFYAHGGRAMHRWYHSVNRIEADFSGSPAAFLNINSAEQL